MQFWLGSGDIQEKIAKLRAGTAGRTPQEAETALRLADKLEQKIGSRLTA